MSKLRTLALLVACSSSALASAQAPPENSHELESLEALLDESVVTTASRSAERASSAPSAIFTITAEDLRNYGIRSLDEALAFLGTGMRVEKTRDYYSGLDVGSRGLMLRDYGRRLLVLVDGHVMNSQGSGEIPLHEGLGVPLEAIDHIEVMLGAGSVMYGSNAMTAVVHVITKKAERDQGVHVVSEMSVAAPSGANGYARFPNEQNRLGSHTRLGTGVAEEFTLLGQPGSLTVRAEWQGESSETYRLIPVSGESLQYRPNESTWGGYTEHTMQNGSLVTALRLGDFTLRTQGSYYERSLPLISLFNDPTAKELRGALRVDLSHVKRLSTTVHLSSHVYADAMTQEERSTWSSRYWCAFEQIDGCDFRQRNVARWVGLEQQLRYEPRADGSLSSLFGYDVRLRDASGRPADYRDLMTGDYPAALWLPYFHEQSVLGALFVQQIWRPLSWLTFNVGGRLDFDSLFGVHPSPRLAVVVNPIESASLRASYSEAFRGPTASELYASDPTYILAPVALGPEVVRTGELEWQQRASFVSFGVGAWIAVYQDLIAQRPASEEEVSRGLESRELAASVTPENVVMNDNVDRLTAYGGTLTLQARPMDKLSLGATLTVSHTKAPGLTESLWPAGFGNFRAAYAFERDGPTLALAAAYAFARKAFSSYADNATTADAVAVSDALDLRATLTTPVHAWPGVRLRAGFGVRVFPDMPYAVTGPSETEPDTRLQFSHDQPQLYLLLGASYDR